MENRKDRLLKELSAVEGEIIAHHGQGGCDACRASVNSVTARACPYVLERIQRGREIQRGLSR